MVLFLRRRRSERPDAVLSVPRGSSSQSALLTVEIAVVDLVGDVDAGSVGDSCLCARVVAIKFEVAAVELEDEVGS